MPNDTNWLFIAALAIEIFVKMNKISSLKSHVVVKRSPFIQTQNGCFIWCKCQGGKIFWEIRTETANIGCDEMAISTSMKDRSPYDCPIVPKLFFLQHQRTRLDRWRLYTVVHGLPVFGVRGRSRGVEHRKPLRVTFFSFARFGIMRGLFSGLRPLADSVCARTFLYLCPVLKPAQMKDSRAQRNWARTNAAWCAQTAILRPIWRCQHTIMSIWECTGTRRRIFFRIHTAVMAAAYSARELKSSAAQASNVGQKLYWAARSEVTGDAAQYRDFAACELVTGVCAHARSPAGLLGNTGYLTSVAGRWSRKNQ
jgi:hypothetical protein